MARMIRRAAPGCRCPRCRDDRADKRVVKAKEERQWRSEAAQELQEQPDQYWLFLNP